ncbi:tetratricopeptide repeat protein [Flavobacterium solisilvae]|uniref:Tetratricopeptide repeat protein n=1 Tax=Flavobacterium solisilvae TaxID=1852019 RepID=A0ABX1QP28_9FLAO|nr:tetratricopeptide repeat protein [Flavobacterium solisilvae]NMH23901.1 tetratricopeptide repeat protein [Flavobacterium solisilvae]
MNTKKTVLFYLCVVGLLSTQLFYAQEYKKLDSVINAASTHIYTSPDDAVKSGEKVVKEAGDNIDYRIKGYKLISDAFSAKRDYKQSLDYLIKALELLNQSNDQLLKINITNKLGIQYHQLKVYDKAIQYLDQAEQLIAEYPHKDSIHVELGKNYSVRGFIYKEKLSCTVALTYLNRGIAELKKAKNAEVDSKISIIIYNKGNCYLLLNNYKLALENFQESARIARKVNAKSLEAFALKGSAKIYALEGRNSEAIDALNQALSLSSDVNDLILNQEIYKGLSENYLATNTWDQFNTNQQKFIDTQNLIRDRERISVEESLRVKKAELKEKRAELSKKFYYLLLILSFVFIAVVLFFYVIIKRKNKEITTIKNQIIVLQNKKGKEV